MKKKSQAFYRYCHDMENKQLSYYDLEEIEDAVDDLLDMNMMDDALYLVEEGMKQHPGDIDIEKQLIWLYLRSGRLSDAEARFDKYKDDGTSQTIRIQFALAVIKGHPKRAFEQYYQALVDGKIPIYDWVWTIEEIFSLLPAEYTVHYTIKAAESETKDAEVLGRIASILVDSQRYVEAIPIIERALDINAYDIFSWQDLARCYMMTSNFGKAMEACEYGLAIDEQNPLLNFVKGFIHYDRKQYHDCVACLEIAKQFTSEKLSSQNFEIPIDEANAQINTTYQMLGFSYLELNQEEKAEECFEILSERTPNDAHPVMQLAGIALMKGDLQLALTFADKAIAINPKERTAFELKVSILTSMGNLDEALAEMRKLVRHYPKNTSILVAYAELARHASADDVADETYRRLLKMNVKETNILKLMLDYFESIDDAEAAEKVRRALNTRA